MPSESREYPSRLQRGRFAHVHAVPLVLAVVVVVSLVPVPALEQPLLCVLE